MQEIVGFDLRLPANDAELRSNVEHALSLDLDDLPRMPVRPDPLAIIANGPSARSFPAWFWDQHGARSLALNGALRLFRTSKPTWWAACDPQPLVADFLADPPADTTYLIASKCHPSVFEALKDRSVMLWHLAEPVYLDLVRDRDPVRLGPTVTICALELADRLGFAKTETWGWDACYLDGINHAAEQGHDGTGNIDFEFGGQTFRTTRNWMFEALRAADRFEDTPRDITIHGGGMIAAMQRFKTTRQHGTAR